MRWLVLLLVVVLIAGCSQKNDGCSSLKGNERDVCYSDKAINASDESFCSKISGDELRNSCIAGVGVLKNDTALCNRASPMSKSYCLSSIAVVKNDLELCASVNDTGWKDSCHNLIAFAQKDTDVCRRISSQSLRDGCIGQLATLLNESASCAFIFDAQIRDGCFIMVAARLGDESICEIPTEPLAKDVCYKNVAVAVNDSAICQKISLPAVMADCKRSSAEDFLFLKDGQRSFCQRQEQWSDYDANYAEQINPANNSEKY